MNQRSKIVIGCSLGECVHVAGVHKFLTICEQLGYRAVFLGPAISIQGLIDAIWESNPSVVGISYRLSPETAESLLENLADAIVESGLKNKFLFLFGGTPPVAEIAERMKLFDAVFSGVEPVEELVAVLKGEEKKKTTTDKDYGQSLVERIKHKKPFPLLRMHFGLPSMKATIDGIRTISQAKILDIISLGTDQDAQEHFFHPEKIQERRRGAGGVPVRSVEDFKRLFAASRVGNFPLMRTYAGTSDLLELAKVHVRTINNCFAAIPIFWFNQLDGRGPMTVVESIKIHQEVIKWYAEHDIPVEINEPHHWSLRDASDEIFVTMAYISAYNAKKLGVRTYVAQLMFNTPPSLSFKMDLAKMLAAIELIKQLEDDSFKIIIETRSGLPSFPIDPDSAKGHLASSTMLQMAVNPKIIHVVSYSEADHAATPDDVVSSCKIVRQVIEDSLRGLPDMALDKDIQERKSELINESEYLLETVKAICKDRTKNPLTDPENLANALQVGILDAPHLKGNEFAKGVIKTSIVNGACRPIYSVTSKPLTSKERITMIMGAGTQ